MGSNKNVSVVYKVKNLKLKIVSVLSLLLPLALSADDSYLCLYHVSGQVISINIDTSPTIIFDNGNLSIANQSFDIKDISKYTFENSSGIADIASRSEIIFENDDCVILPQGTDYTNFSINDVKGIIHPVKLKDEGGRITADLSVLAPGVYILRCKGCNLKFRKL